MDKNITGYQILSNSTHYQLAQEVHKLLKDGWQPFHGVLCDPDGRCFYQTMVRYE